jgi:transposase-like protein
MPGTKHSAEQIIRKLRKAEVELAQGATVEQVCRSLEVTKQTYYRWRKGYGGMEVSQAKRLKELERENARLRKLVAEQALDMLILKEAVSGK